MTSSVKKSVKTEAKTATPFHAVVDNHKRKTNLLQDNSWIRNEPRKDNCTDPGASNDIPTCTKSPDRNNSHVTEENQSCGTSPGSLVNDLANRFGGSQEAISKKSPTLTTNNKTGSFRKTTSAKPNSNQSSFSARVFFSSKLPHNNLSPVIHRKTSITRTTKEVVDTHGSLVHPTLDGTESTVQTKTNDPSNLEVLMNSTQRANLGAVTAPAPVSLTPPPANIPPPIRCVTEKRLCSYCCEPFPDGGARIILEDLHVCSHTACFKCEVCCCPLGELEEGRSLWILRERVLCESCFSATREKWLLSETNVKQHSTP